MVFGQNLKNLISAKSDTMQKPVSRGVQRQSFSFIAPSSAVSVALLTRQLVWNRLYVVAEEMQSMQLTECIESRGQRAKLV